jgi:hypothetical protein
VSAENDDDDWLHALAGRAVRATPDSGEGARLRAALQGLAVEAIDAEPAISLSREERLLAMARRLGLLTPAAARPWRSGSWLALAASIAAVSVAVLWWPRETVETYVVRGAADGLVTITAQHPDAAQAALLADLRGRGITARGYQMLGRFGVDADLPTAPDDELRVLLTRYRLTAPANGVLRVEFVAATPP